jgi:hypothetical protein
MSRTSTNLYSWKDMYYENEYLFYWRIPKSFTTTMRNMFQALKKQDNITWVQKDPYLNRNSMTATMGIESTLHSRAKSKYQFTFLREPVARWDSAINSITARAYGNTFPGFATIVADITNFSAGKLALLHLLPQTYFLNGQEDVFLFDLTVLVNMTRFNDLILKPRVPITKTINYTRGNVKEKGNNFTGFLAFARNFTTIYDQMFQEEIDFYNQFIEFKEECVDRQ